MIPRECARSTGRAATALPLDARQREAPRSAAMAMAAPFLGAKEMVRDRELGGERRKPFLFCWGRARGVCETREARARTQLV